MNFRTTPGIKFFGSNSVKSNTKIHKPVLHKSLTFWYKTWAISKKMEFLSSRHLVKLCLTLLVSLQ